MCLKPPGSVDAVSILATVRVGKYLALRSQDFWPCFSVSQSHFSAVKHGLLNLAKVSGGMQHFHLLTSLAGPCMRMLAPVVCVQQACSAEQKICNVSETCIGNTACCSSADCTSGQECPTPGGQCVSTGCGIDAVGGCDHGYCTQFTKCWAFARTTGCLQHKPLVLS